jgi:hypothetical protein
VSFLVATNFDNLVTARIGTMMLIWVHYEKNGGPEKEFLGDFDTFSAALINLNENAALKRFGRRFKPTPNNKFVEIGPFLKNEDGEEFLLMDE